MKRKVIVLVATILLLVILIFSKNHQKEPLLKDPETLQSYQILGQMEIMRGEEMRKYDLEVDYLKKGDGYYKVSLYDKELNQEQVILRNKEGVFVMTPNLNQIYQFDGDWPNNSKKPYMLESMYAFLNQKKLDKQEDKHGLQIKGKVENNQQTLIFDQNQQLKQLIIENEQAQQEVNIIFQTINYNANIDEQVFQTPKDFTKSVNSTYIAKEDLPMYPMNVFDAKLNNVYEMTTQDETKHILEYKGNCEFTIVQSQKSQKEQLQTVIMPFELYDSIACFGFYDGQSMGMIYGGVEFTIYSSDLSPEEMMEILSSMKVVVLK